MSYFTREDLPFYYELYSNFAVGDAYYQSTFTCTCPNRLHLFAGSNGLSVGQEASMENNEPTPGFDWVTMGEQLEEAGVSWRNYQEEDNFDDNGFAWFDNYMNAKSGDALFDKGMHREKDAIEAFEKDVKDNTLPQVSWIIAPANKSGEVERGAKRRANSAVSSDENRACSYLRTRRASSVSTSIILIPHPNPFRDLLRSSQSTLPTTPLPGRISPPGYSRPSRPTQTSTPSPCLS